ncbi:MAG: hypothetical protein ACI3XX_02885 [Eubacteriales bacterium]
MKMRRVLSVLLIVLALCALTSCSGKTDVPKGMKLASDTSIVDYSLFVPEEWIIDSNDGKTMAHVSETDRSSVSVAQWNLTGDISSIESWWENYKEQIGEVFTDMTVTTEGEKTVVDGKAASKYVYSAKLGENKYPFMVVATVRNGSIYVITYTSIGEIDDENSLFSKNLATVNSIIENFRFN